MQPKLDTITRTDEVTKEKSIVPHTPMLAINSLSPKDQLMNTQGKDQIFTNQSPAGSKASKSLKSNKPSIDDDQPLAGPIITSFTPKGAKPLDSNAIAAQGIPRSLQSKQGKKPNGSVEASPKASKRFDSADLNKVVTGGSPSKGSYHSQISGNSNNRSPTNAYKPIHQRKVSQGSQVDKLQL